MQIVFLAATLAVAAHYLRGRRRRPSPGPADTATRPPVTVGRS